MAHDTITTQQAYQRSTFSGWLPSTWEFDGSSFPKLIYRPTTEPSLNTQDDNVMMRYPASHFYNSSSLPSWVDWNFFPDKFPEIIYRSATEPELSTNDDNVLQRITFNQGSDPEFWLEYNWDTERVWVVRPSRTLPRLIQRGEKEGDQGSPLEHSKHYIMVEPHVDGTMNWDGITWKYIATFLRNPNPSLVGEPGTRVTYAVPPIDENQLWFDPTQNKQVPIKFIASATRDPLGAGGFSNYTNEKVRSDILNNSYSTIINFYFARLSDLPRSNYKLKIQTPTELLEANTTFQVTGPILMSTNPETFEFVTIPYVDINDPNALPVRISTPDGIKALTKYIEDKEYKLKGIDN